MAEFHDTLDGEEWRPIDGFEGRFWISNFGRLRSRRCIRKTSFPANASKYERIPLYFGVIDGLRRHKMRSIHVLVATAFLGPPPTGKEIDHIDGNRANNRLENLRYVTKSENNLFRITRERSLGILSPRAKLTAQDVRDIRASPNARTDELAERFGVSLTAIRLVRRGETYAQVR